jgi:hypothetical protein
VRVPRVEAHPEPNESVASSGKHYDSSASAVEVDKINVWEADIDVSGLRIREYKGFVTRGDGDELSEGRHQNKNLQDERWDNNLTMRSFAHFF